MPPEPVEAIHILSGNAESLLNSLQEPESLHNSVKRLQHLQPLAVWRRPLLVNDVLSYHWIHDS